ncbi:anti-sigma-M factor RsmA [Mycobacterium mantenii]|uniref:Anti-sigma-M factor RsmA n=1 Tax=Mycobacterium mantenii TaxID=560555 RepID=A0A1X0F905_MYCNT|nr:hypothetical protein [Mycobacterium mantenii]MCV7241237.1 hypothetical protein [Mycobacterium mantenii]ORA98255.1 hypothetical protein BST30_25985 [Mycobacterium mantenii]BBY39847.1 anti-sigma-M factor RsmA [Mycobacterium mantenii]
MDAADDEAANDRSAESEPALTVHLLADLQAGILDDESAARVRRQVRADPQAAGVLGALNQVRHDVAAVGADSGAAPDPPPEVAARISAALRSAETASGEAAGPAVHSARPHIRPARTIAAVAGLCAVLAAIGFGTVALLHAPEPAPDTPGDVQHITVSTPPMEIPLSQHEILGLLDRSPDYGALSDPARRASCLTGLGYPASTQVLGARPVEINARPGVVLVIPGDSPHVLAVYAVSPNCSAADTGLLANTQVPRL